MTARLSVETPGHVRGGGAHEALRAKAIGDAPREPLRRHRAVATMTVTPAAFALLFHVGDLAAAGNLEVPADDAPAGQRGETEKPNDTHHVLRFPRRAIRMPRPSPAAARADIWTYRHNCTILQCQVTDLGGSRPTILLDNYSDDWIALARTGGAGTAAGLGVGCPSPACCIARKRSRSALRWRPVA